MNELRGKKEGNTKRHRFGGRGESAGNKEYKIKK